VSGVLGTSGAGSFPPIINAGDVSNKGFEFELGYKTKYRKDFSLNTSINTTLIKNEVKKTPEGIEFLPGAAFGVGGGIATRFQEGYAIGYFTELGSPIPTITIGYNLSASYKGFDISTFAFAALGQEIVRNYERQQPYANQLTYNINRWTGEGSTNENPRLTTDLNRNTVFSDFYVENGSFLRLKNLQVGYTFDNEKLKKLKIQSSRIYVAANNLFTITNYQGYDPDIGSAGGTLAAGIDYGFYPQARTIMTGLLIKF